ncbi:MAG: hypothetical protein AB8G11_09780 [Saprospiraceae bacterium]
MSEIILKYNLLDDLGKQEVQDFIEFLLNKGRKKQEISSVEKEIEPEKKSPKEVTSMVKFREKLLQTSVWSDEEVVVFEENRKL